MYKIVTKEELYSVIKKVSGECEVIGPKEIPPKGIFYTRLNDPGDLYLKEGFSTDSLKGLFLEPSPLLLKNYQGKKPDLGSFAQPQKERVIIGARPCEVRGLVLLDNIFISEYKDSSYLRNRQRSTIVGLACAKPDAACFCSSMGGEPAESRGMDVLLFPANSYLSGAKQGDEERFIIEMLTEKGKSLFGSIGRDLTEPEKITLRLNREKKKSRLKKTVAVPSPDRMDAVFDSEYWSEVSRSCLSCGVCTFLCPTCHCFDLVDEGRKTLRCYDGCAFADFTLEASGVNPRPTKRERYRQRVFHKFNYFKRNFKEDLCVGCGRCIRHCPVKIDIADIVAKLPGS
jgi:ferredoxin